MKKKRPAIAIALLLLTLSLFVTGCSSNVPEPPKKENTETSTTPEKDKETEKKENVEAGIPTDKTESKKETEESGKTEEEKKELVVPDWLRDKSYRLENGHSIHFNDEGYPNTGTTADITIIRADENQVTYEISGDGSKTIQTLTRDKTYPKKVTITIEENGDKMDMFLESE